METHEEMASLRGKAGLSLRALAREAGVGHARICNIENGRIPPSHRDIVCIARGLKVPDETRNRWLKDLEQKILAG